MKKILLVHDAAFFLRMEQTVLRRRDHQIYTATDGYEAMKVAKEKHPDLVILDDALTTPTALEICRQLRHDPRTSTCSIMVSVSRANRCHLDDYLKAGANDYVIKPVNRLLFNQRATSLLSVPTRRFLRTLVKVEIEGEHDGKPFFGTSINLSESGLMVETKKQLEVGSRIQLQFYVPGEHDPILAVAEVVRTNRLQGRTQECYGLTFTQIAECDREKLRFYVERQTETGAAAGEPAGTGSETPVWEPPDNHLPA